MRRQRAKKKTIQQIQGERTVQNAILTTGQALIPLIASDENICPIKSGGSLFIEYHTSEECKRLLVAPSTISDNDCGTSPVTLTDWMFALTRENMKQMYDACPGWGWDEQGKYTELAHKEARFLVLFDPSSDPPLLHAGATTRQDTDLKRRPVAFAHIRYEMERCKPILYLYEVQVSKLYQGQSLGSCMVQRIETLGKHFNLDRIMLTVFVNNVGARNFYKRLGYTIDTSSPNQEHVNDRDLQDIADTGAGYIILSKGLKDESSMLVKKRS